MSAVTTVRRPTLFIGLALLAAACALPGPASATAPPSLVAPAGRAVLPVGVPPTFVLKDRTHQLAVLEVSASPQTDAHGVFTDPAWSTGYAARPDGGYIRVTG